MQVKLYKKNVEYTTRDGEVKKATNYFVECGDVLVPIEIKYFEDKETGKDENYKVRRSLMSAFAEELPQRQAKAPTEQVTAAVSDPTA